MTCCLVKRTHMLYVWITYHHLPTCRYMRLTLECWIICNIWVFSSIWAFASSSHWWPWLGIGKTWQNGWGSPTPWLAPLSSEEQMELDTSSASISEITAMLWSMASLSVQEQRRELWLSIFPTKWGISWSYKSVRGFRRTQMKHLVFTKLVERDRRTCFSFFGSNVITSSCQMFRGKERKSRFFCPP